MRDRQCGARVPVFRRPRHAQAPADVAILELREGAFEFVDNYKGMRTGSQRLFPAGTVLAGKQVQRV